MALVRWPTPEFLWLGIVVNLGIIVLWAWTRTIGIPLFGPHAGEVEPVGTIDIVSKLAEAGVVALLVLTLRQPDAAGWPGERRRGA